MAFVQTANITDTRFITANILQFIADNQTEVLALAAGGTIKDFIEITDSVANRNTPMFPSLAVQSKAKGTEFDGDVLTTDYSISFESVIYGTDASLLPSLAEKYSYALDLMLDNIPKATLLANSGAKDAKILTLNNEYPEIGIGIGGGDHFYQTIRTRVIYRIWSEAQ